MTSSADDVLALLHKMSEPLAKLCIPVQVAAYRHLMFAAGHVDLDELTEGLRQAVEALRGISVASGPLVHRDSAEALKSSLDGIAEVVANAAQALEGFGKPGAES